MRSESTPMWKQWVTFCLLCIACFCSLLQSSPAQDERPEPRPIAERPWATVWMSSLARFLASCDVIYDSVDRLDLADTLEERMKYREFAGIDRNRPLGMMWTWDDVQDPPAIIFLPVERIEELMKTATFDVVDYHKVKDNQYEIERPGVPYHVVVRSGYALFGESVASLDALRDAPDRITRELRDKYDVVFLLDQRQVPKASRKAWVEDVRHLFEPWLQQQDDEPAESATVRRAIGKALLDAYELLIEDVQTVTIAGRIDRKTYQLQLDLTVQAEPGSTTAAELNRLVVQKSEFSALVNREASAGLAINWPLMLMGKDFLAAAGRNPAGGRLDLGIQLIGADWSDMTVIAGLRGTEATSLNAALPHLLTRMQKSAEFTSVKTFVGKYRGVDLHRLAPARVPEFLQAIAPPQIELLIGQGKQTVWFAAGAPDTLQERLNAAVDAVEDAPVAEKPNSIMQARLSVGKWPSVIPIVDPQDTQAELRESKDGFSMSVEPIRNGLKIQLAAEEGLLRVIGRHWSRQVDREQSIR
jgi:hypothetical protein